MIMRLNGGSMWLTKIDRVLAGLFVFGLFQIPVEGQIVYPATIEVPVIFYDFRANGTTFDQGGLPENNAATDFEKNPPVNWNVPTLNMIKKYLDADRKPILNLPALMMDTHISKPGWFRPSGGTGGDNVAKFVQDPVTTKWQWTGLKNYQGRPNEWTGFYFTLDSAMANIVIYDSLQFILTDATKGTYSFADSLFFPLDGKGFGATGPDPAGYPPYNNWINPGHNYSFSMEIHQQFTYKSGLVFSFKGDDDCWAFINDTLKMDLGGIHQCGFRQC